jgi:cytochrome c oxidase subunit IV
MASKETLLDRMTHEHVEDVGSHGEHHIVPVSVYLKVFAALMVLLVLTLVAAYFDLGSWNIMIAMTIAVLKAGLVVLYFMHVRYSSHLVKFFAGATFFWLIILFSLTLADYFSREWPAALPQ